MATLFVPDETDCKGHIISAIFRSGACIQYAKMYNLNLITRKHQTNPNQGSFCKITDLYTSNMSNSRKTRTDGETSTDWERLRRLDKCSMGSRIRSWTRKRT